MLIPSVRVTGLFLYLTHFHPEGMYGVRVLSETKQLLNGARVLLSRNTSDLSDDLKSDDRFRSIPWRIRDGPVLPTC